MITADIRQVLGVKHKQKPLAQLIEQLQIDARGRQLKPVVAMYVFKHCIINMAFLIVDSVETMLKAGN